MVIEDRVLLVDLKDWNERITSGDGRWYHGDRDMGVSLVEKIRGNARKVVEIFKTHFTQFQREAQFHAAQAAASAVSGDRRSRGGEQAGQQG